MGKFKPKGREKVILCIPVSRRANDLLSSLDPLYGEDNAEKVENILRIWMGQNHPELNMVKFDED